MSMRGDWRAGLPAEVKRHTLPMIDAVRLDSRDVQPGDLFVCIPGQKHDGHDFAAAAVAAGAVALVVEHDRERDSTRHGVPVVSVPDSRRALSTIAAAHENYPSEKLTVIGVTGTNGKTTTSLLIHAALEAIGEEAGLLNSVETRIGSLYRANDTRMSTQEAPLVHSLLNEMVDAGISYAVIEATSHGLALDRLSDIKFDVGVLTNFGSDHLDFHVTTEAYLAAKSRLFEKLTQCAVLNADDSACGVFAQASSAPTITYGIDNLSADLRASRIDDVGDGSSFELVGSNTSLQAQVRMPGRFNIANALAAFGTVIALDLDPYLASVGIAQTPGVPGRLQRVMSTPIGVVIDYAHTGEALAKVLEVLRGLTDGRLIVVFGAAGERPIERRHEMAREAARLADYAVLTEEDPRSEEPDAIINDIALAMIAAGAEEERKFERVPDRAQAIIRAIAIAQEGDVVLIAGKGHESTIERSDGPHPWDESAVVHAALEERFTDPDDWG